MKKKLIICLIIVLILIFIICLIIFNKQDRQIDSNITFKEVTSLNYNDIKITDFISNVTCEEECFYNDEKIEYKVSDITELGKQNIKVTIIYQGKEYVKEYEVEIVDKVAPLITLTKEEITIKKDTEFNPLDYVKEVSDNYDELSNDNIKIENKVDINKTGDYQVNYTLTDSSNNTVTVTLKVKVVEDEEVNDTKPNEKPDDTTKPSGSNNQSGSNSQSSSSLKNLINKTTLSPLKTGYTTLDNKISNIISNNTNSSMSKYDKLRAVYDYVKKKITYKTSPINMNEVNDLQEKYGFYLHDALIAYQALYSLNTGYGVCDNYASLFMLLARRIGFDAYTVSGRVNKIGGGTTGHTWVMIKISGKYYIFDPQIEDTNGSDYFGKTDSQLPIYQYTLSSEINKFNFFKKDPSVTRDFKLTLDVTGDYNKSGITIDSASSEPVYYDYAILKPNNSITINLKTSVNQKYNVSFKLNGEIISNKSFTGTSKTINQSFEKTGNYDIEIKLTSGNHYLYYCLNITVK